MIRLIVRYFQASVHHTIHRWDQFWFMPGSTLDVGIARVALGSLAAVFAACWLFELPSWINADGLLNTPLTRFLIGDQVPGTGSMGRISLLYAITSTGFVQGYLFVTILCSLAMAFGVGGRVLAALVWVLHLGIVHRFPMLQGAGDLLFTGMLGYLVIDPGKTRRKLQIGFHDQQERWTARLAIRLMQCHLMIWLLISFVSHLAEPMWWSGSAAWWLASAHLSPWFSPRSLVEKIYLVNSLSHAFLLLHLMTLVLFCVRYARPLAIVASALTAIGIWGLAGDWQYSLALFLCTACFWGIAIREFFEFAVGEVLKLRTS